MARKSQVHSRFATSPDTGFFPSVPFKTGIFPKEPQGREAILTKLVKKYSKKGPKKEKLVKLLAIISQYGLRSKWERNIPITSEDLGGLILSDTIVRGGTPTSNASKEAYKQRQIEIGRTLCEKRDCGVDLSKYITPPAKS